MSDNVSLTSLSGNVAADEVLHSGDTAYAQLMRSGWVEGSEGSKVFVEPPPPGRGATAALSNVGQSASSVTLQAANALRRALIIVNDASSDLYVKYGSSASATSYTYKLGPFEALERTNYTGIVTGIWAGAGAGSARMTEITT